MKNQLLEMHTTEYLCPHCGEWHKLPTSTTLKTLPHVLKCPKRKDSPIFTIKFDSKICTFSIQLGECLSDWSASHIAAIKISDIKEHIISTTNNNLLYNSAGSAAVEIEFSTIIIAEDELTRDICTGCPHKSNCFLFQNIDEFNGKFFEAKIAFRFTDEQECKNFLCTYKIH